MSDQIMKDLEAAAALLLGGPTEVTNEQRIAATEVFTNFKRTNSQFALCRYIMDETKVDYVLFEVADAIRESLIREWKLIKKEDADSMLHYLLMFLSGRVATLPLFVREKIIQVIVTAVKRRSCEDDGLQRGAFLTEIEHIIFSGDHYKQSMGISMITALVHEYAMFPKSSDIGLTMKENFVVKEHFEMTDLKKVFQLCLRVVSNLLSVEVPFREPTETMFKNVLCLAEFVLNWNFETPARVLGTSTPQTKQNPTLKLPAHWREMIVENKAVNLFYTAYWKVRHIPALGHYGLGCLVQLASLQGPIFENDESRFAYTNLYIEGFLKLVQNVAVMDREAIGVSNISRELMSVLPDVLLPALQPAMLECFLEQVTTLTCTFAEGAANEETGRSDETVYLEAFNHMTEGWLNALNLEIEPWITLSRNSAMRIFSSYVRSHLAFPAGTRIDRPPEVEENEELNEPDRVKFKDQLQNIGEFGRHCLEHSMPWLASLIEQRSKSLSSLLWEVTQNGAGATFNPNQFYPVYEDLNWLLLIAGSILSYGTSEIPADVMKYSVSQCSNTNMQLTVYAFTNPANKTDLNTESGQNIDPVIRVIIGSFRLAAMFKRFIDIHMEMYLSPELISTNTWFLERFASAYLLFNEQVKADLSMSFICSFGRDSDGGAWAANFLLEHLTSLLINLYAEPDVVDQSVALFIALVDNKEKGRYVLHSENLGVLMSVLPNLRFGIKREVVRGLTLAGMALRDPSKDCEYWVRILKPIRDRLYFLMSQDDFQRNFHSEGVKNEVLDVLDCLIGVAMGSSSTTTPIIFRYLSPVMIVMPELMHTYHNYQQVVELILFTLVKCAEYFVSYLPHVHSKNLYEASLYTIQEYSKFNSHRLSLDPTSEEDCFTDLLLIIELLSNLFAKDIFQFARADIVEVVERPLVAADVCLFGLSLITPLIKTELLKYPELSLQYYKLISYVGQYYPGKVLSVDPKMLETVLRSIEFGLSSSGEEIIPYCCDLIQFLGTHLCNTAENGQTNPILKPFLKILMNMALAQRLNENHLPKTSSALFVMICCYGEEYSQLVQSTLESQQNEAVKELLSQAFRSLTGNIHMKIHRQNQISFRKNFENFIEDVRGFFAG